MEQKLNIAEILKNKPIGIKLYSPIFGDCTLCYIKNETNDICVKTQYDEIRFFDFEGRYNAGGECLLFPSKEMRDWSKFAWKRGDVLINNSGFKVLFDKWTNDVYTGFYAKIDRLGNSTYYDTNRYTLALEDEATSYIKIIEDKYEGKLNRETLEIDKTQPEFKDGDVLFVKCKGGTFIEIFNYSKKNGDLYDHVSLDIASHELDISGEYKIFKENIVEIRLATEEEKQQLFSALEKEGKRWDAEKKQIVDLKPNVELKPFDKVLVRDDEDHAWQVSLFGYKDATNYRCNNGCSWNQCIPYFGNENLLGTTKNVEG